MRVILIPVADRPECVVALRTALQLGERLGASVVGCHMRPGRAERAHGELLADVAYEATDADVDLSNFSAEALFERLAVEHGFDLARGPRLGGGRLAIWHSMVGTPALIMQIAGPVADLVVVSRPGSRSRGPGRAFVLAGLLHSGSAALVLPPGRSTPVIGGCAVIAWNQGAEAAAAVKAAMPLLQQAERVVVVTAGPEGGPGPRATSLVRYLKFWGVRAERVSTRGRRPEREIEQSYRRVGGDVLVMGAYSRPRLQQLIFGGVTERMLFETDIPVLLYHR